MNHPISVQPREAWWRRCDRILLLLLGASLILRVALSWKGGQVWFPDETRYNASQDAWEALRHEKYDDFRALIFARGDHLGFKLFMILPAMLQEHWHWSLAAVAFMGSGIFSVGNIALVYALARRLGAGVEEARWSAFFAATTTALFYWSRHLMPYELSLCLGLGCLFVAINPHPRWYHSLVAGGLGFACFVVYNGYWLLAGLALTLHVLLAWPPWREWKAFLVRGILAAIGLFGPFLLMINWAAAMGLDLYGSYLDFSATVNQGDFNDAPRMIVGYLWAAENLFAGLWLAALGWFAWRVATRRDTVPRRAWIAVGSLVALGATLVIFSNVLEKFVVYGRLIRQLTPFLALLSGWAVTQWLAVSMAPVWSRRALVAGTLALAVHNFHAAFTPVFGFGQRALDYRDAYLKRLGPAEAARLPPEKFVIITNTFIWPNLPVLPQLPPYDVLLFGYHPDHFRPYLYEGYTREQRAAIAAASIDSYLVLLKN